MIAQVATTERRVEELVSETRDKLKNGELSFTSIEWDNRETAAKVAKTLRDEGWNIGVCNKYDKDLKETVLSYNFQIRADDWEDATL